MWVIFRHLIYIFRSNDVIRLFISGNSMFDELLIQILNVVEITNRMKNRTKNVNHHNDLIEYGELSTNPTW